MSIDNPRPANSTIRDSYKAILQDHFGLVAPAAYKPRGNLPSEGPTAPRDRVRVGKYPIFTLAADAVVHAFDGSYYIQLSYGKRVIGSMAILSRGATTLCSACQRRAADGTRTRGVIDIPEYILVEIIKDIRDDGTVSIHEIAAHIKKNITQKVLGPTGVVLAVASPKSEAPAIDKPQPGSPLKKDLAPSMELLSSFTAVPKEEQLEPSASKLAPVLYFDQSIHGTLETDEHGWTWA